MHIPEQGNGRAVLVLHGGGGPQTVASLVAHLAKTSRVFAPTLPGWNGTPRAPELSNVAAYAGFFARELEHRGLSEVTVVGSSVGGWLAAELALRSTRVARVVIINATGIDVPEHPIANVTGLTPPQLAQVAWHDPSKFGAGAPPMTPELLAMIRANQQTLATIAGTPYMHDPTLRSRLNDLRVAALVIWGASDKVVTEGYGRAFAAAIPGAKFELITEAGHLPQLEQPAETFRTLDAFLAS